MEIPKLHLLPDQAEAYGRQLAEASPAVQELARVFQQLSFPERIFAENFIPAPVYVTQATAVWRNDKHFDALFTAIEALVRENRAAIEALVRENRQALRDILGDY